MHIMYVYIHMYIYIYIHTYIHIGRPVHSTLNPRQPQALNPIYPL